ncbi:MAG: flagellar hook-length control protein FliK [Geothrix sp.]|nr:flagellar hook-length control protein FliK [Geothrix sp.]
MAVADRPVAERPEAKEPEAPEGQFAGLMARWIQPPTESKAPEKAQPAPEESGTRRPSVSMETPETPSPAPEAPLSGEAGPAAKPGSPPMPAAPPSVPAPSAQVSPAATNLGPVTLPATPGTPDPSWIRVQGPPQAAAPPATGFAEGVPGMESPRLDPVPSQAPVVVQASVVAQAPVAQAGLAEGPPRIGEKAPTGLPAPSSLPAPTPDPVLDADPGDPETATPLPMPPAAESLPGAADPARVPASPPLHADGNAMAAISALPRASAQFAAATPVVPPATAAPPPPTAPVAQVEGGLRWMLKGGSQEARLQLHPESLGRVTIHLRVEGGEVHARLWITEPASVQAIQEGRPLLELSLKEQGLQLGSFDLQQGHRPFQEAPSPPVFRESVEPKGASARQEAPAMPAPSLLNSHHIEIYA